MVLIFSACAGVFTETRKNVPPRSGPLPSQEGQTPPNNLETPKPTENGSPTTESPQNPRLCTAEAAILSVIHTVNRPRHRISPYGLGLDLTVLSLSRRQFFVAVTRQLFITISSLLHDRLAMIGSLCILPRHILLVTSSLCHRQLFRIAYAVPVV